MFIKAFTNSNSGFNLGAYSMTEKKSNLQLINISMQQTPGNYKHFRQIWSNGIKTIGDFVIVVHKLTPQ